MNRRITEYLDIDLDHEVWRCHRCGHKLGSARDSYKRGCLVYDRDPKSLYPPDSVSFCDGSELVPVGRSSTARAAGRC